jgi:hypothetical protein
LNIQREFYENNYRNDTEFKDLYIPQSGRDDEDYQEDLLNIFDVFLKNMISVHIWDILIVGIISKYFHKLLELMMKIYYNFFNDLLILDKYGFKYEE